MPLTHLVVPTFLGLVAGVSLACTALAGVAGTTSSAVERAVTVAASPVRTLIITGQNNHNWRYTSRFHADTLEATGRFDVTIADDAPKALADAGALQGVQLFVLDYNGPRWGEPAETNFLNAVRDGAGVVIIHAANNAFVGWSEYEKLCGPMWIRGTTGHGPFHEFTVEVVDAEHPIMAGMPASWTTKDELYHKLVNTADSPFTLLARAMSAKDKGGTGEFEPMAMTLQYGKGRVFHTPLGHVWTGQHAQKASIANPGFRALLSRGAEWAATGAVTLPASWGDTRQHNVLTSAERAEGWTLLFDGTTVNGLRGYKQPGMPEKGWVVEDGVLRHVAGAGGGDIITVDQFTDFEFQLEWQAAPGANSGVMYRVAETDAPTYVTGPEMQILDITGHRDAADPKTSAGALYGLEPAAHDVIRPAGEWNHFRIVCKDGTVQHWANGVMIVEYTLNGPDWADKLKGTKFADWPRFGREPKGHIAIQDHGDEIRFRNIKVRSLD
jgi:type 1 glutamine amidotransferase